MRKISFIMAALALVLGVTQCKKENKPLASGETQRIVLTASNGNDGSKVLVGEATKMLNLTWQDTDEIAASGAVEGTLDYKSSEGTGIAKFEGSVTKKEGNEVTFSYGQKEVLSTVFSEQTGDVAWIQDHLYLESDAVHYNDEGVYGEEEDQEVEMKLQYAVLKLDLSALGTEAGTTVTISNASGPVATVAGVKTTVKVYYVAMPAAERKTYTFSGNDKSVKKTWPLVANTFYTANDEGAAIVIKPKTKPADALSGLFSVSDDEQVWFSKGNLQYVKDGAKWQFAANQWETVETSGQYVGTNYGSAAVQTLFGWGDLIPLRTDFGTYSWTDWGIKIGTGWCTLSGDEWDYLINTREVKGETGFGNTCQWVIYNGVAGLIIYPDVYDEELYGSGDSIASAEFPDGCVFLPAAGHRTIHSLDDSMLYDRIVNVGTSGIYWSTSPDGSRAKRLEFENGSANIDAVSTHNGFSVRLVYNY